MIRSNGQRRNSAQMQNKAILEALETRQLLSTYTVGPGGNFTTLQAAANVVQAGDVVNVAAGNYAGFQLSTSGTASAPITFNAATGVIVNGAPADLNGEIDISGCSYVTLNGFDLELNGSTASRAGIWGGGYAGDNVNGLLIENNTVNGADWWGILIGFANNSKIIGNTTENTQVQHGIYLGNSPTDDVISGNVSFNNRGCGIEVNCDATQGGSGIGTGIIVSDNRLYNNAQGIGAAINFDGVQDSIIENNLIYGAQRNGIALYQINGADAPTGDTIVNNTIVMNSNGPSGYAAISLLNGAANTKILNNVLSSAESSMCIDPASLSGLVCDYNVFGASGIDPTGQSYSNNVSFSAWQAMGYDSHSTYAGSAVNSLFVNAAAGDVHLVAGSAAIGAGTSTDAPATDFYGNARPTSGRYDVGAIQYQGQPATTQPPTANANSYKVQNNQTLSVSAPGVLSNDSDPNGLSLSASLASGPAHGTLTLNSNGSFVYKASSGYVGADSFAYTATDGEATSSAATVTITVTAPPASPPTANADSYQVQNNQTLSVSAPGVLSNDSDPNGLSLSASLASGPAHGTLTLNADGSFAYTPSSGYVGADSFTYTATDGQASSSAATVAINVTAPPVANPPPGQSVPTAPTNLVAQSEWGNAVALTWSDTAGDANQFKVERSEDGVNFEVIATVDASVTSYVDGGLVTDAMYMYQVVATNAVGDSVPSNTAYAKTYAGASWREMMDVWMPSSAQPSVATNATTTPSAATLSAPTPSVSTPSATPVASDPISSDPTLADNDGYQRQTWLFGDQSNLLD